MAKLRHITKALNDNGGGLSSPPVVHVISDNLTPIAGWRFVCGKPCSALIEGLTENQRVRGINKIAKTAMWTAQTAASYLVRGKMDWMSPQKERVYLANGIEAAQKLIEILTAADAYLAALPEPPRRSTVNTFLAEAMVKMAEEMARNAPAPEPATVHHLRPIGDAS